MSLTIEPGRATRAERHRARGTHDARRRDHPPDNADYDRHDKQTAYAYGRVPVYVLIDSWAAEGARCIVYSDPAQGEHRRTTITPFGETVKIPKPIDLDTSRFG